MKSFVTAKTPNTAKMTNTMLQKRQDDREKLDGLANKVIDIAIGIHRTLGPGFIENIYARALAHELREAKINFNQEKIITVKYKDLVLGQHRLDLY